MRAACSINVPALQYLYPTPKCMFQRMQLHHELPGLVQMERATLVWLLLKPHKLQTPPYGRRQQQLHSHWVELGLPQAFIWRDDIAP